jgi:PHD/YefM family antitoxin component YafN of YafNO toxin-antitoxin module
MSGYEVMEMPEMQYIYQKNEKKGVIMDIQTFEALMEMLEDYEDAVDFEVLKTEETRDYEEYRRSRLKQDVVGSRRVQIKISMLLMVRCIF